MRDTCLTITNEDECVTDQVNHVDDLLRRIAQPKRWDHEPVFCFSSDIDWASEVVLTEFFRQLAPYPLKLTTFVTHPSEVIETQFQEGRIERGPHPNFVFEARIGNRYGHCWRNVSKSSNVCATPAVGKIS